MLFKRCVRDVIWRVIWNYELDYPWIVRLEVLLPIYSQSIWSREVNWLHAESLLTEWDLELMVLSLFFFFLTIIVCRRKFLSPIFFFHLVPQFKTRERTLQCTIYSLTFKLWLRSYPQVLAAFNELSEQGFVVKWWTTLVLHAWNARLPHDQGLRKVQMF